MAELEKTFKSNGGEWKEFKLVDLFHYKRGTRLIKEERIDGDYPLVTAGEQNQGVKKFISNEEQEIFKNAITIDMFCNSFVHINEFCCDDNILVLNAKSNMSHYCLKFISAIINKSKSKWGYGKQYRINSLKNHKIQLPVNADSQIAFDFMESFIKALEKESIKNVVEFSETKIKAYKKVIISHNLC